TALAADQTIGTVTATERFQRVTDLHGRILVLSKGRFDGPNAAKRGLSRERRSARDGAVSKASRVRMSMQTGRFRPDLALAGRRRGKWNRAHNRLPGPRRRRGAAAR